MSSSNGQANYPGPPGSTVETATPKRIEYNKESDRGIIEMCRDHANHEQVRFMVDTGQARIYEVDMPPDVMMTVRIDDYTLGRWSCWYWANRLDREHGRPQVRQAQPAPMRVSFIR